MGALEDMMKKVFGGSGQVSGDMQTENALTQAGVGNKQPASASAPAPAPADQGNFFTAPDAKREAARKKGPPSSMNP